MTQSVSVELAILGLSNEQSLEFSHAGRRVAPPLLPSLGTHRQVAAAAAPQVTCPPVT